MSDRIVFNKEGVPLLMFGKSYFAATKGAPDIRPAVTKQMDIPDEELKVGAVTVVPWGDNNEFPTTANNTIRSVGVLNTGLKFIRNFTLGQGIFPCRVTGYDEYGNETLEIVDDPELIKFLDSRMVRRYLEKLLRDYLKFGCGVVQIIPSEDGSRMVGINTINALWCRFSKAEKGVVKKLVVSAKWPDTPAAAELEVIDMLDDYDPMADMKRLQAEGKISNKSVAFAVRDSWSNAEYYSEPIWLSAYVAGWVGIAQTVPVFLKSAYQNQISWKWHVQIPYAFWDKKFPKEDYADPKIREQQIETYLDAIEENLCDTQNANKAIFTFFEVNPNSGKHEEQWLITPLDNKYKESDKLITSAAANSEILFSLMLNPNVLGAGMPGGTYAGNQGGSNIREAFLVNIANAWLDRHNILDPLELMLEYNGITDIQLRFRSTILTTLDTGAGTKKVQS